MTVKIEMEMPKYESCPNFDKTSITCVSCPTGAWKFKACGGKKMTEQECPYCGKYVYCNNGEGCPCDDYNRWIEMARYYQDPADGDD